jgi:hypothetical protein
MVTAHGTLIYGDERRVDIHSTPIDYMHWDRWRAKRKENADPASAPFTFELYIAFAVLQRRGELDGLAFEPWCETVAELDLELVKPDPTPAEASAE